MGRVTRRTPTTRFDVATGSRRERPDTLAVEEPLEIRVDGESVVTTMRTPGDDVDLALGWLLGEGLIARVEDVASAVHCNDTGPDGSATFNVLDLTLAAGVAPVDLTGRRTFAISSACGVCGSATIDAIRSRRELADLHADPTSLDAELLADLPGRLRVAQRTFERTGGLHAAGLFDAGGSLLVAREDVGRHNACDKVVGWAARTRGLPLSGTVLVLSGRTSFELMQKAWAAGVPVVASVSAPSSLAVELAAQSGQTLCGFVRPPTFVCYGGAHRLRSDALGGPTSASTERS